MTPNDIPGNIVPRELVLRLWREPVRLPVGRRPQPELRKAA
jgi:hypothetical protein